jgi:hypothetical protein
MKKIFEIIKTHRKTAYVLIILACAINGLAISALTFNQSFDMGDSSTFFDFDTNLNHGEAIYKDFIHFRTPGTEALQTSFIKVLGDKMDVVALAIRVETLVLYPVIFLIAAAIIFRKKRNPLYLLATFAGIAYISEAAQLRAGFGLLAVALYIASFELKKHEKLFLFLTGLFAGITFIFGQEIALMVGVTVVAGELFNRHRGKELRTRLKLLIGGAVLGVLPLAVYLVAFSSVRTFLYYAFWYSFIVQPKYMNSAFPSFGIVNLIYFLPFVLYWLCFMVLYANRKLGKTSALLLGFGILRLITALGRSDFGHLMFSIPEIFIIVPYFLFTIKDTEFNKKLIRSFTPYGILIIALFLLAKVSGSLSIVVIPFVILYALEKRPKVDNNPGELLQSKLNLSLALGAAFAVFVILLFPNYHATISSAVGGWHNRHNNTDKIQGVIANPVTYEEVTGVETAVSKDHPNTIFSFPIIAFFDTLAPHHASRYITFEFETQPSEQDKAISDLERTKPQVVVFDPLQAEGLSSAVWKISDYITTNYQIQTVVSHTNIYWVMTPKASPSRDDKLVYQLYKDNTAKTADTDVFGIQSSSMGLNYAIDQVNSKPVLFNISSPKGSHLQLSVENQNASTTNPLVCGNVLISYGSSSRTTKVCSSDGNVSIPIKATPNNVQIRFENPTNASIIWNNPGLTN